MSRFNIPFTKGEDGTNEPVTQFVTPLDITTDPMTYTMPVRIILPTPDTFKTVNAFNIGSTALWTPAAGKRFRVMGYTFTLPSTATSAAGTTITLVDGATPFISLINMGTTTGALAASVSITGNGYLSTTVNNVLNINCSATLTAGAIVVSVWGTEE